MTVSTSQYGFGITVKAPFSEALDLVKQAFLEEGFGVVSELDVQRTLREKTDYRIEPYHLIGFCNPVLAARAIEAEHEAGLLLPCNVLLHECGGAVHVSAQDPAMFSEITGNPLLEPIAGAAKLRIEHAFGRLCGE